jgi:hypothetical protein
VPATSGIERSSALADALAARHLADAGVAGVVLEQDQVADEERGVGSREVQQHAVLPGHGTTRIAVTTGLAAIHLLHGCFVVATGPLA